MTGLLKKTVIMLILAALPSVAAAELINGIAAVVNGEPITTYEVDKEADLIAKTAEKKLGPTLEKSQARTAALNQLIDKKLIAQKIKELDIKVTDEEVRLAIEDVKKQNSLTQEALISALGAQGLTSEQYKAQLRSN
jgi:peptidyl-prolyl cis-trans isomerase SurA